MTTNIGTLEAVFTASTSGFDAALSRVRTGMQGAVDNIGAGLQRVGDGFSGLGRNMVGFAAPAIAGLTGAGIAAASFEESMVNAQSILGVSGEEMAGLNAQILELGASSRAGPQQAADAFYTIVSGVADASTHMAILEAAMATSEAGAAELSGTTSALVSIMNAYGFAAEDASFVSDTLTRTVQTGVLTMDELAAALPNVTGLANSMGLSLDDVAGSMAFITTKGFSASEAATQLRASMVSLLNPNQTMTDALSELGFASGEALVEQYGLIGAMEELSGTAVASESGMAKMFGSVEALNAVLSLTGEGAGEFLTNFEDGLDGATEAARDIQMESAAAQFDLLKSEIQVLAIEIGKELLPGVRDLVKMAKPVVKSITSWAKENPELVKTVAMLAGGIGAVGAAFMVLGPIIGGIGTAITVLGGVIGVILSPIGLLAIALGGLAFLAYKTNFLGFADALENAIPIVKEIAGAFVDFGKGLIAAFQEGGIEGAMDYLGDALDKGLDIVLKAVVEYGPKILDSIEDGLPDVLKWLGDTLIDVLELGLKAAVAAGGAIIKAVKTYGPDILNAIEDNLPDVLKWLGDTFINVVEAGLKAAVAVGGTIVEAVKTYGPDILDTIVDNLPDVAQWLITNLTGVIETGLKNAIAVGGIVLEAVRDYGPELLRVILEGLGDLSTWVTTNVLNPIENKLVEGLTTVGQKAYDLGKKILDRLMDALSSLPADLVRLLNRAIPDSINIDFGWPLGSVNVDVPNNPIPIPALASGGAAMAGQPYLVGERGPELFVPNNAGHVMPNSAIGGRSLVITGPVNVYGVQNVEDLLDQLHRAARHRTPAFSFGA